MTTSCACAALVATVAANQTRMTGSKGLWLLHHWPSKNCVPFHCAGSKKDSEILLGRKGESTKPILVGKVLQSRKSTLVQSPASCLSQYGGFLKWWVSPKSHIYRWIFHGINHPFSEESFPATLVVAICASLGFAWGSTCWHVPRW